MMLPFHIEKELAAVESHFDTVSAALVTGDPLDLEAACLALRQAAMDFSGVLKRLTPTELKNKSLKARLKIIIDGLAVRRESLIRRTVLVERALSAVVPATQSTTYTQVRSPYGSAGKSSGAFKSFSA